MDIVLFFGFPQFGTAFNPVFVRNEFNVFIEFESDFIRIAAANIQFILFLSLRYFGGYGNPEPRKDYNDWLKTLFSFFNVSKYPPSLQFYGMTLGVSLVFLALIEPIKNRFTKILMVYGKVPFFYYIVHLYLLHLMVVAVFFLSGFSTSEIAIPGSPFLFVPPTFGFSLPIVYVFWFATVVLLYQPCIWFQKYKSKRKTWWLSYL